MDIQQYCTSYPTCNRRGPLGHYNECWWHPIHVVDDRRTFWKRPVQGIYAHFHRILRWDLSNIDCEHVLPEVTEHREGKDTRYE